MPNSASRLHAVLRAWTVGNGQLPEVVRGFGNGQDRGAWRAQIEAVHLLEDVERLVGSLEAGGDQVAVYQRILPKLWSAVFGLSTPWNAGQGSRAALDEHAFDILEGLAGVVDAMGIAPEETDDEREALSAMLASAEALASEDDRLPKNVRRYVIALVHEARDSLADEAALTGERARSIRLTMGGLMVVAAQASPKLSEAWLKLSGQFLLMATGGAAGQIMATLAIQEITAH